MLQINSVLTEEDIFKYQIKREEYDIKHALGNNRKLLERIKENIFSDEWAVFYEVIKASMKLHIPLTYEYYNEIVYSNLDILMELPQVHIFEGRKLSLKEKKEELLERMLTLYDNLELEEIEEEGYLDGAMELYIQAWAREAFEKVAYNSVQILNDGLKVKGGRKVYKGLEDNNKYINESMEYINSIKDNDAGLLSVDVDTSVDTVEDLKLKEEEEQLQKPVASSGIESIDMNVSNFYKGEIVTIQAGTGIGKTRLSVQVCHRALTAYKSNVLYISLEQKATRVFPMFQARHIMSNPAYVGLSNMSDSNIIRNTYNMNNQVAIDWATEDLVNNEEIGRLKITGRSLFANELKAYMNKVWDEGFHFDVLVLDYIGLLSVAESDTRYNAITDTINMLKAECKSFKGEGFLAIIPHQLTTAMVEALNKGDTELTRIGGSESQYIARASDNIFTLHQTTAMQKDSTMELITSKVRLGAEIPPIKLDVDKGKCYFAEYLDEEDDDLLFG